MNGASRLLRYVEQIDRQGLNPGDYAPDALRLALASGKASDLDAAATHSFGLLARDLAQGHVPPKRRGRYFIVSDELAPATMAKLLDRAAAGRDPASVLDGLAPDDAQYPALSAELARLAPGNSNQRRALRVNLERLRWLPRDLAPDRLVVNIPEYAVRVFQAGRETASFRVIVGKPATPTPQFSASVTGVILNPAWQVPSSIIAESVGSLVRHRPATARARGYVWSYKAGALSVTQQPGPQNALGRVKLDMPNPYQVYLHDTPDKALFEKPQRAFSHGCIRTDRPRELAAMLLGESDLAAIDRIVESGKTSRLALPRPVPVYVVYQTALVVGDGSVRYLDDPYGLDPSIAAALDDQGPASSQSMPATECGPP